MSYELFIAFRYLRAKRRQAAISFITGIAVAGISVGVAALIVAQALITGFRADVQDKILEGTAHLNLPKEHNRGIENYRDLVTRVRQLPGVRSASARFYTPALLGIGERQEQAILKGVDLSVENETKDLSTTLIEGDLRQLEPRASSTRSDPDGDETAQVPPGIVVGKQLARALGLRINDTVTAISSAARLTPLGLQTRPRYTNFRVVGIFLSGLYEYDSKWAYISLASAQRLTGGDEMAGMIQMKVEDIYSVNEIGERVRSIAGKGFITTNWQEL